MTKELLEFFKENKHYITNNIADFDYTEFTDEDFNNIINSAYPDTKNETIVDIEYSMDYITDSVSIMIWRKPVDAAFAKHLYSFNVFEGKSEIPGFLAKDEELTKVWRKELKARFGTKYVEYIKNKLDKFEKALNGNIDA